MASIEASGLVAAPRKPRRQVATSAPAPDVRPWPKAIRLLVAIGLGAGSWASVIALARLAF